MGNASIETTEQRKKGILDNDDRGVNKAIPKSSYLLLGNLLGNVLALLARNLLRDL